MRAIALRGWRAVVSCGQIRVATGASSNPTIESRFGSASLIRLATHPAAAAMSSALAACIVIAFC